MKTISDDIDYLKFLGLQERQFIEPTTHFLNEVKQRFEFGYEVKGDFLPWKKSHEKVGLRPGEVSVWAGINGHGKSLVLGQVMLWLPREVKILIASLEMKPAATLERMCRQSLAGGVPTEQYIDQFGEFTDNIFVYDQTDSIESNRILGMIHYAAKELGINHIMVDSLMKCGIGPDDYAKQKEFVDRLCWAAKTHNIHIHLVHHIRKGIDESKRPNKFDIKGGGEITDLVDNVFIVHRNKNKEREAEKKVSNEEVMKQPDETLTVDKQRHGEWEGTFGFWFHKSSQQFVSGPDAYGQRWRE